MKVILYLAALGIAAVAAEMTLPFPRVWTNYTTVQSVDKDFADLLKHGVGVVNANSSTVDAARQALINARRFGMKYTIQLPDITEDAGLVKAAGFPTVDALMIGGVYQGKAIDRHLFHFTAGQHDILIEPPVYDVGLPYTVGSGGSGIPKASDPIGHYWPDMPPPARAEIVVPLRRFDSAQHLKIVPATIVPAAPSDRPQPDSAAGVRDCPEIRNRRLYRIRFDLTGLGSALLDHVGIAVYWPYHGTSQYWLFGRGTVSAAAPATREAVRAVVRQRLSRWTEANDGAFPGEVIAARFGDECFYLTGHTAPDTESVSYPLWEYSEPGLAAFRALAGNIEAPRTWGFPEIYGTEAYAWWLYSLHQNTAELTRIVKEEASRIAPALLIFRNTTRNGIFSPSNDHDGSGPELLTRQLDLVHLDPYPVSGTGYSDVIPRDMGYYAGLARRYRKPLVPWLQAHTYSIGSSVLTHVSPEQVDRMGREHLAAGADAVVWLGYCPGCTFPGTRPDSWERAAALHRKLAEPRSRPHAELAVLRSYRAWSLTSYSEGRIRNPADWHLQQWLDVWAVKHGLAYDVFELPPVITTADRARMIGQLQKYRWVVSNEPWPAAWVITAPGVTAAPSTAGTIQSQYEIEIRRKGMFAK
jgi:hypothetical protein